MGKVEAQLLSRDQVLQVLKERSAAAQNRMSQQHNPYRRQKEYNMGDRVYLNNYPQGRVSRRSAGVHKLSATRTGKVAYKLQLPEGAGIHPVFHVSRLTPGHARNEGEPAVLTSLPEQLSTLFPFLVLMQKNKGAGGLTQMSG